MKNPVRPPSHFDWIVRWLSVASLAGTLITSTIYFMSLRGRGVDFMTHILLGVMLGGQFVIFFLGVIVAAFLTARRGQFGLAWFTSALFSVALAGLAGQYYAVQHLQVDSSSIP